MHRLNPSINGQIISEVEKCPILYDYNLPDFKNVQKKYLVWSAIAKKVGAKNGKVINWKWKNLRDTYSKYKKHLLSPHFGKYGVKTGLVNWRWGPLMTFLDPYLRKPKEFLEIDIDSKETAKSTEPIKRDTPELLQDSSPNCPFSSSSFDNNINNSNNKNKRKYVETIDEVLVDPFHQENLPNRLDMTDYLFLNYAETFKKLSRKKQALLKLNMAKMFAAAELEELDSDPIQFKIQVDDSD